MIDAGMNILVINLSMVTRDVCNDVVKRIRELEESYNHERLIAIVIDVTGAPVRTGTFKEVRWKLICNIQLRDCHMKLN